MRSILSAMLGLALISSPMVASAKSHTATKPAAASAGAGSTAKPAAAKPAAQGKGKGVKSSKTAKTAKPSGRTVHGTPRHTPRGSTKTAPARK